jgi:hypothetical protein
MIHLVLLPPWCPAAAFINPAMGGPVQNLDRADEEGA